MSEYDPNDPAAAVASLGRVPMCRNCRHWQPNAIAYPDLAAPGSQRLCARPNPERGAVMRYISMFSGIEAASVAWHPLGWEPVAFAEIEKFPSAVLAHRFPDVPNLGDITTVDWSAYRGAAELVVGGSPCQSFSVAGLRKGLADPRGNLALEYLRAVDGVRPRWMVWENVPGVLSSDGGRAFGAFLGGLAQLGYGFAYRVLDAQYVRVQSHARAVPQRRRRVFVVGCLGDWRSAAAVLLERESVRGNPAPRREAGEGVAQDATCGTLCSRTGLARGVQEAEGGHIIAFADVSRINKRQNGPGFTDSGCAFTLTTGDTPGVLEALSVHQNADGEVRTYDTSNTLNTNSNATGRNAPIVMAPAFSKRPGQQIATKADGGCFALTTGEPPRVLAAVAFRKSARAQTSPENGGFETWVDDGIANTLNTFDVGERDPHAIVSGYAVRVLTPLECERLQGFPDGWTDVPYRGKQASDGPRYKAIGNSMAVNVMRFVGERIQCVEQRGGSL